MILATLISFLITYVEPYVVLIALLAVFLWVGMRIIGRRSFNLAKDAIKGEVKLNIRVCSSLIEYTEGQKVGDPYSIPIPRFYTSAFDGLRNQGYLFRLKGEFSEELITIYTVIERVHAASDRQEELAVGPAATSPLAADLRSKSLTFIRDTVRNVIRPRLERLDAYYGKR